MSGESLWKTLDELPAGRSVFFVALVHAVVEHAAWIAIAVVAYDRAGASGAGVAAASQLIPAALLAPTVAGAGDRFARHRVLLVALSVLALSAAAIAIALAAGAPLAVLYSLGAVFTAALTAAPATVASLAVSSAPTPGALTTFNGAIATVESLGSLVGPALTAVALASVGPTAVFVGVSVVCLLATVLIVVRVPVDDRETVALTLADVARDTRLGLRHVTTRAGLLRALIHLAIARFTAGGLGVVILAVVYDELGGEGAMASLIVAALAAGGVAGSLGFVSAVRRRTAVPSLAMTATVGGLLMTLPIVALLITHSTQLLVVVVVVAGVGGALVLVGTQTIMQRLADESMTGRVFGVQDSATMLAEAMGALCVGTLIAARDLDTALVAIAGSGSGLLAVSGVLLRRAEAHITPVDPERISALRQVPFFAPLALPTIERLARFLEIRGHVGNEIVIKQHDTADDFFVLLDGDVDVEIDDRLVRRAQSPDFFGEIALLRDVPRTATIRAATDISVAVVTRDAFLDAVLASVRCRRVAHEVAESRSSSDPG